MPAIDIDRDTAHEAARHELAKPIYPKASWIERFKEWLNDLLYRIINEGVTVLLIGIVILVIVKPF